MTEGETNNEREREKMRAKEREREGVVQHEREFFVFVILLPCFPPQALAYLTALWKHFSEALFVSHCVCPWFSPPDTEKNVRHFTSGWHIEQCQVSTTVKYFTYPTVQYCISKRGSCVQGQWQYQIYSVQGYWSIAEYYSRDTKDIHKVSQSKSADLASFLPFNLW